MPRKKRIEQYEHKGKTRVNNPEAGPVIAALRNGPPAANAHWIFQPGDVLKSNWIGKTFKDEKAIDACRPDEWLVIEAWDES